MKTFKRLTIPYIVWMVAMIVIPMLLIVVYAFTKEGNDVATLQFTLDHFKKFFTDPDFLKTLWLSLRIAFITTVLCILIGYPVAYAISKASDRKRNLLILLITLPMWINMLVRTYAWIGILADNGLINHILQYFGFDPVKLLYTDFAVVLGMVYNFVPFMILQIESSLAKMDQHLLEAANDLGANRFERFRHITLPLSLPGVISGITLVFLPSVSSFVIPKLMGGGGYMMIGNIIENQFITVGEWNFGSAISLIMAVIIMISMYVTRRLDKGDDTVRARKGGNVQ
ncbi:ABC transporter permease [[Eubacterium] hominis]|uniref:ABC transporter permease n=1 Tax=[Eubacterium] hominis TaxID=2764325 RepID=UPI003A4DE2A0